MYIAYNSSIISVELSLLSHIRILDGLKRTDINVKLDPACFHVCQHICIYTPYTLVRVIKRVMYRASKYIEYRDMYISGICMYVYIYYCYMQLQCHVDWIEVVIQEREGMQ